jgi:hypothetical protein
MRTLVAWYSLPPAVDLDRKSFANKMEWRELMSTTETTERRKTQIGVSSWSQDSRHLVDNCVLIANVLDHTRAKDKVDRPIRERQPGRIGKDRLDRSGGNYGSVEGGIHGEHARTVACQYVTITAVTSAKIDDQAIQQSDAMAREIRHDQASLKCLKCLVTRNALKPLSRQPNKFDEIS